jgi:hypothetical protein
MIDPFPTIFRAVSGSVTASIQKLMLDSIARVQKIQGHPAYCTSIPPKTGPRLGATFGLKCDS